MHFSEEALIFITTPLYAVMILGEVLLSHYHERELYSRKDSIINLVFMLINAGIDLAFRTVYFAVMIFFYKYHFTAISNPWVYWISLLLAEDFIFYWLHRMEHNVRLFWAVHVTHHSSPLFNLTTGFRSSVFQPLYRFIFFIPLVLAGFKPLDIMFMFSATQVWGIFVHTQVIRKMGFLEYFLVTPSHHRVHHASNTLYLDRNMGMFFIIWDKMFGTFQPEMREQDYEKIRYGITKDLSTESHAGLLLHEWRDLYKDTRKSRNLSDKLKYIFAPPGWSPDGSTKTTKQLMNEIRKNSLYKFSDIPSHNDHPVQPGAEPQPQNA